MRKQALVCAAALAVGIVSSMAQNVYSLNVVGYYNVTVPAGKQALVANQFNTTNNTLASLIPSPPPNSQFFKYVTGSGYTVSTFDEFDLVWSNPGITLNPGEGGFFKNGDAGVAVTLTFVGEVPQGNLSNPIPAGYSIRSSMVPQATDVNTMQFPAAANDQIFKYVPGSGFTGVFTFDEFDLVWAPSVPSLAVGEAVFVSKASAATWTRSFTVN